jgi:hypothetical protein
MMDLKRVRAVALDIAGAGSSHERQDDLSEFIWHLLERHYRMFLFSTESGADLGGEDFTHPGLVFLRDEMPPSQALLRAHPELLAEDTLWVTDDAQLQRWIGEHARPFTYLTRGKAPPAGGQHVPRLSELSALLDPTALLLDGLAGMVADLRRFQPAGALLVGIGGPPLSGYQQFALDLRMRLQSHGHELVELLDVSSLMRAPEALLDAGGTTAQPWVSDAARHWVRTAVLAPLRAGQAVYAETRPPELPADFDAHFPLYLSEASVVLLFGELLLVPEVREALHLSVLLEVAPDETTRRLYELPAGERFDPKFTAQYQKREGGLYEDYLQRYRVREQASLRVDANRAGAFFLHEGEQGPLV